MAPELFERALRSFTRRRLFRSFTIEMISGDRFVVTHPEVVTMHDGLVLFVAPDRSYRRFDAESVCQFLSGELP